MSSENQVLLSLSCKEINENFLEKINDILKEDLDWNYILGKAIHNRVIPQLYANLNFYVMHNQDHHLPRAMLKKIRQLYYSFIGSTMDLHKEATHLFQILNNQNVQYAPIKGILLAETVYTDKHMRFFEDVDLILLNHHELKKTRKILKNLGYERSKESVYIKRRRDMLLKFDLHSSLSIFSFFDYPPQLKDFWELSTIQNIGGVPVTVMRGEYMLLLLCLHSFSTGLLSLRDLSDSLHILKQFPTLNWDYILQKTEEYPCEIGNPLQLIHLICTIIFGVTLIPENFLKYFNKYFILQVKVSEKILEEHVYPFSYAEICLNCEKNQRCKLMKYISLKEKILGNHPQQKNLSKMKTYLQLGIFEYNYIFTIILKKYGIKYALQSFFKETKGILYFLMSKLHDKIYVKITSAV